MFFLLIGYMWLFIHRPFEVWPVLGEMRLELAYVIVVMIVWAFYPKKHWLPNPLHAAFLAFAVAVVVCWLASSFRSEHGDLLVENYFKQVLFYILLATVIRDEKSLKLFVNAFLVIMFIYMGHSLREYINGRHAYRMGFVRMIGVDTSMGDPNTFAASILYSVPLLSMYFVNNGAESPGKRKFVRLAAFSYFALAVACILFTGSRSAFVGLLLLVGIVVAKSAHRWRFASLALLAAPVIWLLLPASLENRFETIIWPEVGPANAQASANARFAGLETGVALWAEHPLFGIGPGNWRAATHSFLESHNLYGELLGEMGTLGGVTFAGILLAYWINLRRIKVARIADGDRADYVYVLASAIGLSVLLMLVEGNFSHNLFRFNWQWFGAFLIVARSVVEQRQYTATSREFAEVEEGRCMLSV